jgi:hypothetical protein
LIGSSGLAADAGRAKALVQKVNGVYVFVVKGEKGDQVWTLVCQSERKKERERERERESERERELRNETK